MLVVGFGFRGIVTIFVWVFVCGVLVDTKFVTECQLAGNRFGKIASRVMVYWPQEDSLKRNILSGANNP